ncbi:MAG TPA: lysophospholipid acyltransferase family protein [Xanthobacteraceae bacterium]|nr:lysophospholipid acyltransferase family protein [Xanthobacteraceae bacterium]
MLIFLRSLIFNILFYLNLTILMVAAIPTLVMPHRAILGMAKFWARTSVWLLRVVCGTRVEWRGLDKLPRRGVLVAAKHQSTWETFALVPLFDEFAFIVKRELMWVPLFGWFMAKGGMIPIDRGARTLTIPAMIARAREALRCGRAVIIFPEGTRRPAGAEPAYKFGIARLYAGARVPCVPIALNSGLFWPRRRFLRYPGTIVVEILDPIPPGLDEKAFFARLQREIEAASGRLIAEARARYPWLPPPGPS